MRSLQGLHILYIIYIYYIYIYILGYNDGHDGIRVLVFITKSRDVGSVPLKRQSSCNFNLIVNHIIILLEAMHSASCVH